jgi:hypothetical protein
MKTQILNLRSGTKNQILNAQIDYSKLPAASSHAGHSGSNSKEVKKIWEQVTAENPDRIKVKIRGIEMTLTANYSRSQKSVCYFGTLSKKDLEDKFCLKSAQSENPYISIQNANIIIISNGQKNTSYVCPSLIEIL